MAANVPPVGDVAPALIFSERSGVNLINLWRNIANRMFAAGFFVVLEF
jgi:hypothetical protein